MNANRDLLHWSNLLYALLVIASLFITQRAGSSLPAGMDPAVGMILAQVGLILIPTLIFVWLTRQPPKEILKLQRMNFGSGVKCFLIGLVCWPISLFLFTLAQMLVALVIPARAGGSPTIASQGGSPWLVFLGVALVAPLCEEALFRGVMLSAYEKRFAVAAVWMVGILFAFFHPSLEQALGVFFLGTVAGWVVFRMRSIWGGVLVHMGNNLLAGLVLLLTSLAAPGGVEGAAQTGDLASMAWMGALVWGGIGLVMLVPLFFLLRSIGRRYPAPAWPEARFSLSSLWSFAIVVIAAVACSVYILFQGAL